MRWSWGAGACSQLAGGWGSCPVGQTAADPRSSPPGGAGWRERGWKRRDAVLTPLCCSLPGLSLSIPTAAPFLLPAPSPGRGWGMMKAPRHSPILRGPKRALLPLKLLSKAPKMKTNVVLICSFFYSIIKTAANLNRRHKIAGGKLCHAGKSRARPEPAPAPALSIALGGRRPRLKGDSWSCSLGTHGHPAQHEIPLNLEGGREAEAALGLSMCGMLLPPAAKVTP